MLAISYMKHHILNDCLKPKIITSSHLQYNGNTDLNIVLKLQQAIMIKLFIIEDLIVCLLF